MRTQVQDRSWTVDCSLLWGYPSSANMTQVAFLGTVGTPTFMKCQENLRQEMLHHLMLLGCAYIMERDKLRVDNVTDSNVFRPMARENH